MESRWDVFSDCGNLVLHNVTREEALEAVIIGITDDLHFTYVARRVED